MHVEFYIINQPEFKKVICYWQEKMEEQKKKRKFAFSNIPNSCTFAVSFSISITIHMCFRPQNTYTYTCIHILYSKYIIFNIKKKIRGIEITCVSVRCEQYLLHFMNVRIKYQV